MQDLIREYKETIKQIRKAIQRYENKEHRSYDDLEDMRLLESMERDLRWSLEWMETGRRPGNRRGVERLAAYQREKPIDPIHFQRYAYQLQSFQQISDVDMARVEDALSVLTALEREVYLTSRGYCLSFSEIAGMLGVAKGTVQKMIERAESKMRFSKNKLNFKSRNYSGIDSKVNIL